MRCSENEKKLLKILSKCQNAKFHKVSDLRLQLLQQAEEISFSLKWSRTEDHWIRIHDRRSATKATCSYRSFNIQSLFYSELTTTIFGSTEVPLKQSRMWSRYHNLATTATTSLIQSLAILAQLTQVLIYINVLKSSNSIWS